ncbi:zinc finger MYND domain-containing protein 11-like [Centruroides sculpturatus]|uniref:zinc finger MYND domain-containing protein 11-like n=1 Tax=Centruroides sculpturatus TaxID=218467 RepID=UPI000C6E2432|nr:zinc finger MYND domain-containing protein 11-like [Centruroides sculpturatus]
MISSNMLVTKRRLACPQTVQHLWDAIAYIRQQKQIPNFERISGYMKRIHNLNATDVERQLNFSVRDELVNVKKSVGFKGSKVGVEQEGYRIPEEIPKKDEHDWYCFECHRGGEVVSCTSCHRVYHSFCIKEEVSSGNKFVCSVCKQDDEKTQICWEKHKTRELHRMPHPDEEKWRHDFLIYEKMDLIMMEEKTKSNAYKRLEEFQADAQCIVHNVVIFFGVHSGMADLARQMLRDCIYDLGEIRQCRDCYRMSNEKTDKFWFCQPCDPPHELVYAKQKGFPYWPAKVIRKTNDMYDVRFFGGYHQRANIEKENIRPITTTLQQMSLKRTNSLNKALEELRHHQQLIQNKCKSNVTQQSSQPISSSSSKKISRSRTRKCSESSEVVEQIKSEEVSDFEMANREASDEESPSSSSPKVSRLNDTPLSEDHNVVSSSSQETPVAKVTVATQTKKFGGMGKELENNNECNCSAKYSKIFRDFRERLETEHKEDKERSLKDLTERVSSKYMDTPLSEDHNVVSSSSQETPVAKVTVATQTKKFGGMGKELENNNECNCSAKYSKIFRDFRERLETEHKEDKERSLKDLTERLQKEFEEEKQKAVSSAMDKLHREMEQVRRKTEEQLHTVHQQQIHKMMEDHHQEISDTKKKQWCYNCEAEAIYHCCWNTSYCSVDCQQIHWHKEHKRTCRRKR